MPENLGKITVQERKKSSSGLRATYFNTFFALDGKFPGVGTLELSNPPSWGRKKRANDILFQLTSSFVIELFLLRLYAVTTPVYSFSIAINLFSLKLIARCKINCY